MDRDKFIKEWLEGKIGPDELRKSEEHQKLIQELEGIIETSSNFNAPSKKSKEQAWDDLMAKIEDEEDTSEKVTVDKDPKTFFITRYIPLGIAATLLVIVVAYFLLPRELAIESGRGELVSHQLPDGSKVTLNADSEIAYSKSSYNKNRIIKLKGEAFFEVESGKSFIVKGEQGSIEVLGTSFNAYFRKNEMIVSCFTGKVMVKRGDIEKELNSGQIIKSGAINDLASVSTFDSQQTASWRSGEFYFDQAPLSKVLSELERQFDIEVEYSPSEDRIYNGYFSNKNLDEALQLVFVPMSLDYSLEGNKVTVK